MENLDGRPYTYMKAIGRKVATLVTWERANK